MALGPGTTIFARPPAPGGCHRHVCDCARRHPWRTAGTVSSVGHSQPVYGGNRSWRHVFMFRAVKPAMTGQAVLSALARSMALVSASPAPAFATSPRTQPCFLSQWRLLYVNSLLAPSPSYLDLFARIPEPTDAHLFYLSATGSTAPVSTIPGGFPAAGTGGAAPVLSGAVTFGGLGSPGRHPVPGRLPARHERAGLAAPAPSSADSMEERFCSRIRHTL
jgi:hypothetical protein